MSTDARFGDNRAGISQSAPIVNLADTLQCIVTMHHYSDLGMRQMDGLRLGKSTTDHGGFSECFFCGVMAI